MIVSNQNGFDVGNCPMKKRTGVARRLERLREVMGFKSQRAFANFLGVSPNRYNNVERGAFALSKELAIIISRKCPGVTTDWLLEDDATTLAPKMARALSEPLKASERK